MRTAVGILVSFFGAFLTGAVLTFLFRFIREWPDGLAFFGSNTGGIIVSVLVSVICLCWAVLPQVLGRKFDLFAALGIVVSLALVAPVGFGTLLLMACTVGPCL
ncbi:MAG TPA: hypothetical protein VGG48_15200 [Rhizomicrobium sp.]|jgi:hypothetical protein